MVKHAHQAIASLVKQSGRLGPLLQDDAAAQGAPFHALHKSVDAGRILAGRSRKERQVIIRFAEILMGVDVDDGHAGVEVINKSQVVILGGRT